MLIFKWDPLLELGIELIDTQHRNIMRHANAFFISYKGGNPHQRLQECLTFLEHYVLYHFQAEEAFQSGCNYPGYPLHRAEHISLKMQFKFQTTKLISSDFSSASIDEFYEFMRHWISEHILNQDMEFATYYRAQGGAQNDTGAAKKQPSVKEDAPVPLAHKKAVNDTFEGVGEE